MYTQLQNLYTPFSYTAYALTKLDLTGSTLSVDLLKKYAEKTDIEH